MLTNTAAATSHNSDAVTPTLLAIQDAERRHRAALQDITALLDSGQISALEACDLEAETLSRFAHEGHQLETRGAELCDPDTWSRYTQLAAEQTDQAAAERLRSPLLRGLSARARATCERQMAVVRSARVDTHVLRFLLADDDPDAIAARGDLAAAGLL